MVLAGTDDVAIGPADVTLEEGVHTIVYAWGSAADANLALAVQTIDGSHSSPGGVPGGSGGQAAGEPAGPALGWLLTGAVLAGGAAMLALRRRGQRVS